MALDLVCAKRERRRESGAFVRRASAVRRSRRGPAPGAASTRRSDDLSLTATMPRFSELERRERSVILAWRANRRAPQAARAARAELFVTFQQGWRSWSFGARVACRRHGAAQHRIDGIERRRGWRVSADWARRWRPITSSSRPSRNRSRLVRYVTGACDLLANPVRVLGDGDVRYRRADMPHHSTASLVVPRTSAARCGCTFSSVKYPVERRGHALLLFMGGALNERMLERRCRCWGARGQLRQRWGSPPNPSSARRALTKAMPPYSVGHAAVSRRSRVRRARPAALAGGASEASGLRTD